MPYNSLSTIIFLAAIVGIILMILRRLPEAMASEAEERKKELSLRATLAMSGRRTARVYYKVRSVMVFWSKRAWNFALEAKGMRHPSLANYRIRKIFRGRKPSSPSSSILISEAPTAINPVAANINELTHTPAEITKNEQFYLKKIREEPRNFNHYSNLAQCYLGEENFIDAQNVYDYLVQHDPSNSSYQAKLAYCKLNLKSYEDAAVWYEKSLALDPGHPNRYYNLALAYKVMGKRQVAARAIRRALELEPQNQKYRELLKSV